MSGVDREPLRAHMAALIGGDRSLLPADGVSLVDGAMSLGNFESIEKIVGWIEAHR
ncbi:MAG: hypothetical protein FD124_3867 [Alphaproteobacteria bacterium]|nr:MAG: hypothetical protein FD124_3867 [Alphaproteobacteria bacterium]